MKKSDWITVVSMMVGIFLTTIGSVVHLSYKIGGIDEKITSLEKDMTVVKQDIKEMKADISELCVETAEMRVKVDELWEFHLKQIKASTKSTSKTKLVAF